MLDGYFLCVHYVFADVVWHRLAARGGREMSACAPKIDDISKELSDIVCSALFHSDLLFCTGQVNGEAFGCSRTQKTTRHRRRVQINKRVVVLAQPRVQP